MATVLLGQRLSASAARAALALLVALFALVGPLAPTPHVAFAHAELTGSEPPDGAVLTAAPASVRLFFSEPIEREFYALEVYTARRARVDRNNARIPRDNVQALEVDLQPLEPGIYTIVWRALSIDGHVVRGVLSFSVGVPGLAAGDAVLPPGLDVGGAPFALGAAVRWLTYLAAAALVGGFAFAPLVLTPALETLGAAAPRGARVALRRFGLVGWTAVAALIVLTLLALVVQAADAASLPLGDVLASRAVTRLLTGTKYGTLWLARAGAVAALLAVLSVGAVLARPTRWLPWVGTAAGAALLLAIAATGHASAVPRRTWLTISADWLHLLAGAIWIGGLLQLALTLPPLISLANDYTRRLLFARTIQRFSLAAGLCVAVVITTGVFASTVHVPSWQAMADTFYGAALTTKLLLVAPLLLFGAVNLLIIHPRLVRAARTAAPGARQPEDLTTRRWFRRLVLAEATFGIAVFAATAWLSGLPPATTAPGEGKPVQETIRTPGAPPLTITFEVTPNQAGTNSFVAVLADAQGRPTQAQRVAVALSHVDMEMGEREVVLTSVGNGRYEGGGGQLSMAGRWRGELRLRGVGGAAAAQPGPGQDLVVPVSFTTGQPPGTNRPLVSPARILLLALNPTTGLAAVVLVIAALLLFLANGPRIPRRRRVPVYAGAAFFAVVGIGATGLSVSAAYQRSVAAAQPVANPIPTSPASLARGQQIYASSCLVCHGVEGRGDGPAGRALRPPPADLRVHMAAGHTDQQLFDRITNGVPGTAMPAWKEQLTPEERWHVINYIRSLAAPQ